MWRPFSLWSPKTSIVSQFPWVLNLPASSLEWLASPSGFRLNLDKSQGSCKPTYVLSVISIYKQMQEWSIQGSNSQSSFFLRITLKHVYYQVWNRSPVQVGFMIPLLRAGALGWPRGMGCGGRQEGGSGWGTHANPWLIHVNVWQKPLQYCKLISLQLIKINEEKKNRIR